MRQELGSPYHTNIVSRPVYHYKTMEILRLIQTQRPAKVELKLELRFYPIFPVLRSLYHEGAEFNVM